MFQIITPATDLSLLTIEELRSAVGLSDSDTSQDEKLTALGARVSAMIAAACQVSSDGVHPPTLLIEGCLDQFRLKSSHGDLFLSRRPVAVQITSLTEAGVALAQDVDFELDTASGKLTRLRNDESSCWVCGKIVVEYDAGYETVPDDLKAIAAQLAGGYWADDGVDPMEKRVEIPGVISTERWVDQNADGQMPKDIMNALISGGYVNRRMVL